MLEVLGHDQKYLQLHPSGLLRHGKVACNLSEAPLEVSEKHSSWLIGPPADFTILSSLYVEVLKHRAVIGFEKRKCCTAPCEKNSSTSCQVFIFYYHFSGKSNSKVIAHIGGEDFTVRINTAEEEYNIEVYSIRIWI